MSFKKTLWTITIITFWCTSQNSDQSEDRKKHQAVMSYNAPQHDKTLQFNEVLKDSKHSEVNRKCDKKKRHHQKCLSTVRVVIVADDQLKYIQGQTLRGKCHVNVEVRRGLTVSSAERRLLGITRHNSTNVIIVHAGSNDVLPELNTSAALVSHRLKHLIDRARNRPGVRLVVSGILPRYEDFSGFNNIVSVINSEVKTHAQHFGMDYVDHIRSFWKEGHLRAELYNSDGSLNEEGKRALEDDLLEGRWCQRKQRPLLTETEVNRDIRKPSLDLKDILPKDRKMYDKHVPPKKDGRPTIVDFHITVLSIDSIDEESMTYVTDIFLAQSWHDYRLRLPENMTEDYRILNVEWLKYIWRPDSFFKNAKKVTFHDMTIPNHYLWLYYDKSLLYMAKLTLELSCAMKFEAYPHDIQVCSMMIESLSHTTDDLVFRWNLTSPLVVNPDIELPQLDIVKNTTEYCTLEYSTGNFTCLAVVFNLKRRLGYHLFHTYVPTALIVVMSWISFWIRPEAIPARVTLGVTSLLTLATQNTQSQSSLPPVSYIKAIDVWMSSCTVFVFMSLMEFAIVNYFMGYTGANQMMRGYSTEDMEEKILRRLNGDYKRRFSLSSPRSHRTCCGGIDMALSIDHFSRYFFPMSFLVLNVAYWYTFAYPW